jgi:NhaP-type Na+/H+ or K+/H+ antiporter
MGLTLLIGSLLPDLLFLAAIIGLGALLGWLFELIHIPSLTGFFLSGILMGLILVGMGRVEVYDHLSVIGNISMSFIAFELGTRLFLKKIRHNASEVIVIVLFQALFTIVLVGGLFMVFGAPWEMALLIGIIAMATSPETIMVLSRKYKTHGHLTDAIMPHIGFDDIVGVILFSVALAIAGAVNLHEGVSLEIAVVEPLVEIFGSVLAGGVIGGALALFIHFTQKRNSDYYQNYLTESIVVILLLTAITSQKFTIGEATFGLSPILTPMFGGIVFTNLVPKKIRKDNDAAVDSFTPPFILAFFALIGVQLVINFIEMPVTLWIILGISFLYVLLRVVGKQLGVFVGSKVKETPKEIVKYLVWSLLPQATVSIGMASIVLSEETLPEKWRQILFLVILIAAFVYNAVGPFFSERALVAAKEISPDRLTYLNGIKEIPEKPEEKNE